MPYEHFKHDPVVSSVCYIEINMNILGSLNIYIATEHFQQA